MSLYKGVQLPENICEQALDFTKRFIDSLDENMILSPNDELSLYLLANAYDQYIEASRITKEKGLIFVSDRSNESISASVKIMKDAHTQIMGILKEMSGTIRSRSVVKQLVQETEESPLKELMNEFKK